MTVQELVKRMRKAQARYLAERRSDALAEVVRIERQVDQAVADVLDMQQPDATGR